jgi:hypothetical protein
VDIEHYRTLLQNEERRLLGIIRRKKENVRSIGGDSVPDAGDASYEGEVREEQARSVVHWTMVLSIPLDNGCRPTSHTIDRVNPNRSAAGFDLTPPALDQRTSLEADLTPEESEVLLRHGTEAAFCGGLLDEHREGVFTCRLCGPAAVPGGT